MAATTLGRSPASGLATPYGADHGGTLDGDAIEVGEEDLAGASRPGRVPSAQAPPAFHIDEDFFHADGPASPGAPIAPWSDQGGGWPAEAADLPGPAFMLPDEEERAPGEGQPVIDSDEEVPERYWAPEVGGLGRRMLSVLVDQTLLALLLGVFFFSALVSLRLTGFDTDFLLAAAGLQAAAAPFALLAALLSLCYHVYFHGATGSTPGKALAGLEVRTGAGAGLSWGRAILRWFCAALSLGALGAGVAWALFEPRRRGWADLLSGTVIARRRSEPDAPLTTGGGRGYHASAVQGRDSSAGRATD